MQQLPLNFQSTAQANHRFEEAWTIKSGEHSSSCAIPPEFGGQGGGFSPEDLFLQAAINCFVGTFKVVARLSKLSYSEVSVTGQLTVDKNESGKIVMKSVHLDISVKDADRPDRLENIVSKTIRDGFILNSIRSDLTYQLQQTSS